MTRLTKRLVIMLFPLVLTLPAASILLPIEPDEIENRRLEAPEVELDRLAELRFYRELGAYIRDGNPIRALLIRAGTGIDFHLFGDSPNPLSTLVGIDGWLYRRDYLDELCQGNPVTAVGNLTNLVRAIEEHGAKIVFTVAPSKFSVMPEYLTADQARLATCGLEATRLIQATLASGSHTGYVDSWALFSSMKAMGIEPYFKTDTHFNYVGSIPWMHSLIDAIQPRIWEADAVQHLGNVEFLGNIAVQVGIELPETVRQFVIDRGLPRTPIEQLHDRFGANTSATHRYEAPTGTDAPLIRGRTVVLADSFMDIPAPSLVQYFADITIMDWRSDDSITYFLKQAVDADVVIIELADHGLLREFATADLMKSLLKLSE